MVVGVDFQVCLITDRTLFSSAGFLSAVEAALKGGVRALQLREKDLALDALLDLSRAVKLLTRKYGASLVVNGSAEIAEAVGAEGVHLPENQSATVEQVRKKYPGLLVGVSVHSLASARSAESMGADYITFSPIFDTPSKRQYGFPQGLGKLREVTRSVGVPVLALGGITVERIPDVMNAGAFGVALMSGIWNSDDIEKTAFEYIRVTTQCNCVDM
jgi:thiamine-phosphate pyrophosphorylase